MAEKISWHCWATKKCGYSTASKYFKNYIRRRGERQFDCNIPIEVTEIPFELLAEYFTMDREKYTLPVHRDRLGWDVNTKFGHHSRPDKDYQFIITRNPYTRLTSFYINKIIFQAHSPERILCQRPYHKKLPVEYCNETINLGNPNLKEKYCYEIDSDVSFREFVDSLSDLNMIYADPHLQPQWFCTDGIVFDKQVKLENFSKDIIEVSKKLDWPEMKYKSYNNFSEFKSASIIEFIGDKPASWFRKNSVPADYIMFYLCPTNPMLISNNVYNIYKEDFIRFNYDISHAKA